MRTLLALLLVLSFSAAVPAEEEIAGVEWLTDLDDARAKARESGRPILAVFR